MNQARRRSSEESCQPGVVPAKGSSQPGVRPARGRPARTARSQASQEPSSEEVRPPRRRVTQE